MEWGYLVALEYQRKFLEKKAFQVSDEICMTLPLRDHLKSHENNRLELAAFVRAEVDHAVHELFFPENERQNYTQALNKLRWLFSNPDPKDVGGRPYRDFYALEGSFTAYRRFQNIQEHRPLKNMSYEFYKDSRIVVIEGQDPEDYDEPDTEELQIFSREVKEILTKSAAEIKQSTQYAPESKELAIHQMRDMWDITDYIFEQHAFQSDMGLVWKTCYLYGCAGFAATNAVRDDKVPPAKRLFLLNQVSNAMENFAKKRTVDWS